MGVLDRVDVDGKRLYDPRIVRDPWFVDVPAIGQLCREGVALDPRVTVVVGENGSGKSTFVGGIARHWGDRLTRRSSIGALRRRPRTLTCTALWC